MFFIGFGFLQMKEMNKPRNKPEAAPLDRIGVLASKEEIMRRPAITIPFVIYASQASGMQIQNFPAFPQTS